MIVLIRCNNIYIDSRLNKYISFIESRNLEYKIIGWDRMNEGLTDNHIIFFRRRSAYSLGGIRAVKDRVRWMVFVYIRLNEINRKNKITSIHACDLDAAFPSTFFKIINSSKTKVIFDVFDWFSATLYKTNKSILQCIKWMEKFTVNHSDEIIICEPERIEQIPYRLKHKELVVPNIPSFPDDSFLKIQEKFMFNNEKIILSYVGGFYNGRMLEELLTLAGENKFNLLIAGFGNEIIERKCKELSISNASNVKYYGRVPYKEGLNIMYNSDIVYAMYSIKNPNHIYAAPNKYYEAMFLGKPIISTNGTILEKKITNNGIGYVIDECIESVDKLCSQLNKKEMSEKGNKAKLIWNNKYKNYISDFFETKYIYLIK